MNLFVVFKGEEGGKWPRLFLNGPEPYLLLPVTELVTPPLDGMILPGVTRDSVLALARNHASGSKQLEGLPTQLKVSERGVNMGEVIAASNAGRLVEIFGTGTAAIVTPVEKIGYLGRDVVIPTGEDGMGPVSRPLWKTLVGIQTGEVASEWNFVV